MNIPFILQKAVSLYADKEAVFSEGKRFTYGRFADRVYRLSNALHAIHVSRGDRIAILHQNSHEFLESYFAAAQTGSILVPLNYRLSPPELAQIIKDSGARVLISARDFKEHLESLMEMETGLSLVILTGEGETFLPGSLDYEKILAAEQAVPPSPPPVSDDDIAHLYYTSGTTGRPKGVMLSHRNVCSHALAAMAEFKLDDRDNWIHAAPLFHLADAWATFAVTWAGGKHTMAPRFDPALILSLIQQEGVTITNMIPTMLNMLVNTPGIKEYALSSLRAILSGGAPIAPEVVRNIINTFHCEYIQTYGMTETSPYLTVSILKEPLRRLPEERQFDYRAKTGRPFLNVLLKVVRENGEEVRKDDKEVGEIIVKGDSVTRGYWNRPEETAAGIKNGWLYTGDLAVVDGEGYVNIVDRKKDMIITGGENVFSVEVENTLYSHPSVLEAAVIGVPDPVWGEAVKAVVVLKPGARLTAQEAIDYCKRHIAKYKAPKSVDFMTELPKTGSGKISKKALREGNVPRSSES